MTQAAEAVWLELDPDPALVLLDRPDPRRRQSTAVLFCPPFGWDEMCSYRGRRDWARLLAQAGYACARITLPGTGDSGGSPRRPALVHNWVEAIAASASWLRTATTSERVVGLGIGLGGMLACLAARQGAPIDDFVLWDVRASGRPMLRELRAHAGLIGARYPEDERAGDVEDEGAQLTGFLITAETARDLESARAIVPDAPVRGRRRVLLLGRDRLGADRRLREQFEAGGAEVTVREGPDFTGLMSHPQESLAPVQTIRETIAWLSGGTDAQPDHAAPPPPTATARARLSAGEGVPPVFERPLRFTGEIEGSFAVLTEPVDADPSPLCVVWLNGGALHHIGPNRVWVETARRWAARGVSTVRVDLPGIGESDGDYPRPIATDSLYYGDRTRATEAILDQLTAKGVADRFVVGGLCSGAYWALQAALTGPRVTGLMLLNLWAFFWTEALVAERATERSLHALRGRGWQRLVRGQLTAAQIREGMASLSPGRLRAGGGYPVQRAQTPQIEAALDRLRDQGTETLLLLCQGEQLLDQLVREQLLDRRERWPNFHLVQPPTRDHMFRAPWLQRYVHDVLDQALDRVLAGAGHASAFGPPR